MHGKIKLCKMGKNSSGEGGNTNDRVRLLSVKKSLVKRQLEIHVLHWCLRSSRKKAPAPSVVFNLTPTKLRIVTSIFVFPYFTYHNGSAFQFPPHLPSFPFCLCASGPACFSFQFAPISNNIHNLSAFACSLGQNGARKIFLQRRRSGIRPMQ